MCSHSCQPRWNSNPSKGKKQGRNTGFFRFSSVFLLNSALNSRGFLLNSALNLSRKSVRTAILSKKTSAEFSAVFPDKRAKTPTNQKTVCQHAYKLKLKKLTIPIKKGAPIVQDIFRSYLAQTEPVANLKRRYSEYIYAKMQLYRMLRNRLYIGEVEYGGKTYQGLHEPIIDRATFDAVNAMLPGRRRAPRPSRQIYKYLLTGLVYCHCGKKMTPYSVKKGGKDSDTRYFYYKCQDVLGCKYAINAERLDAEVLNAVREIALDDAYLEERYKGWLAEEAAKDDLNKERLQKFEEAISEAKKALTQIDCLFLSGVVDASNADYWNEKLAEARIRVASLESQKKEFSDSLMKDFERYDFPSLLQNMRKWADLIDHAESGNEYLVKRNILLAAVRSVKCVDRDGSIELEVMTNGKKWRREGDSNP